MNATPFNVNSKNNNSNNMNNINSENIWMSNACCGNFIPDTSSSSDSALDFPCGKPHKTKAVQEKLDDEDRAVEAVCANILSSTTSSSTLAVFPDVFDATCPLNELGKSAPNINYEFSVAKSILQQYSSISGDNLYDHLADIIKRVIDEKPPNVIDFFEEFSRNVREQKLHLPDRFPPDCPPDGSRAYRLAKQQLLSMKLPMRNIGTDSPAGEDEMSEDRKSINVNDFRLDIEEPKHLFVVFSERLQQLQFYWNQCGFSVSTDDIFQLACAMDRLQTHPSILQCRFWGVMNGMQASYYIVEATLTRDEVIRRHQQMQEELQANMRESLQTEKSGPNLPSYVGPELTPGVYGWEHWPREELLQMVPAVEPVPLPKVEQHYDTPPEMIGTGLNRYSYFVVNNLSEDWMELPVVTPKQIVISRQMKKFLTGDLEAEVDSYPCFPGKEKHYLRALISRITCGTTIAPHGYYRKMTKLERRIYDGMYDDEMEGEEEEEEEDEPTPEGEEEEGGGAIDNDLMLLRSEKYSPAPLEALFTPSEWVHVRPYILQQGRVVWFDEEKAKREREKEIERLRKLEAGEEIPEEGEEEEEDEDDDNEIDDVSGEGEGDLIDRQEYGPRILSPCSRDQSDEFTLPWVARFSSLYTNKVERVLVLRSNVWPGAFSFTFGKICESIYMGWGHKYVARNMPFHHLPPVYPEYPHEADDFMEAIDPSVEQEEAVRLWQLSKEKHAILDQYADGEDIEVDDDTDDGDDDEDDDDEE